jgi:hypothetical protein
MKQTILAFLIFGSLTLLQAQGFLLIEDFDYAPGAQLRDHGWTPHSAGGTNPLRVGPNPLAFTNTNYIGGGIGGAALIDNTGSDENKFFNIDVDSGSVYAAFLMKPGATVTSSGTGFFFHLVTYSDPANPDPTSISTAFRARTFIVEGSSPDKFRLGLTFNAAAAPTTVGVDLTDDLDTAETYLVVVKYTFVPGPDNDVVSLFVFEDGDNIDLEPATPTLGPYGGTAGDAPILQGVALRQYNAAQNIIVDGIRVRTDWNFKGSGLATAALNLHPGVSVYPNPLSGNTLFLQTDLNIPVTASLTDLTGRLVLQQETTSKQLNVPLLPSGVYLLTLTQRGHVSTHRIVVP